VNPIGIDRKKKNQSQGSDLSKIIKIIMERGLDPVIIFSFSKKDV
jgi:superfamily II RNA helicase